MSYLLETLGRGLLCELAAAFRQILADDGRHTTASLRQAAAERPDDPEALTRLGARCLADRDYSRARDTYAAAVQLAGDDLGARAGLACALDELGDLEGAIEQLEAARRHHPDNPALLFSLGFCFEKAGHVSDAVRAFKDSIERAPQLRNAHERLAAIQLQQGDVESAIDHYEHLCFCEPGDVDLSLTLGNLYLQVGMTEEAIRRFQFALTIEPDNWDGRNDLAAGFEAAGLYAEAIEQIENAATPEPDGPDKHLRLGDLYSKLGADNDALEHYLVATRLSPDHLEAVIKVGTAQLRSGNYLEAAHWFNKAVEINDRLLVGYVGLAVAQLENGDADEARATLDLAAGAEPNSTLLFSEMARLQLKVSANREADRCLSPVAAGACTAVDRSPSGDLVEQQIERHRLAIAQRPNHADLHYRLGLLLRHRNRVPDAIRCFRNALAINPHYLKALVKLAVSHHDVGETDAAVEVMQRALAIDPHTANLHYQLGLLFADQRKFSLAVEQFDHASKADPKNIDFQANLALALQNMGLIDRASASWQTLCDMLPETPAGRSLLRQAIHNREREA